MSTLFAILFYFATLVFVVGTLYRISVYTRTPAPLKIPTTPAPITTGGVVLRMMRIVTMPVSARVRAIACENKC